MKTHGFHEDFSRSYDLKPGSNRKFGLVFAVAFLVYAGFVSWKGDGRIHPIAIALALCACFFLVLALFWPDILAPLNRLWLRFGLLLSTVTNFILLCLIFSLAVVPTSWMLRLFGKDPLRLRFEPEKESYWIARDPPGPEPKSMLQQF